jgi:hypothetical protein
MSNEDQNSSDTNKKSSDDVVFPTKEELLGTEAEENNEPQEENNNSSEENSYSDIERQALDQGWVPKDQFKGDRNNWTDAGEYIRRGKLIDRIGSQSKELQRLQKTNEDLINLVKKQSERIVEEKATEVLQKKREAISVGDIESAERFEKKYNEYVQEQESIKAHSNQAQEIDSEYKDFVARNKYWLNNNTPENAAMVVYADNLEQALQKSNPNLPLSERLEEVENGVKTFFASRFDNPNRRRAPAVEAKTSTPKRDPKKVTFDDLPEEAKRIVNNFVRVDTTGKLSRDEYAQQLVLTGAVDINRS